MSDRPRTLPLRPKKRGDAAFPKADEDELRDLDAERPRTRGECGTQRPCPFVGCRHHLALDVHPITGSIHFTFPGVELEDMEETCVLDVVAERGSITLEESGRRMNLTRERIRQIEVAGIVRLRRRKDVESPYDDDSRPRVERGDRLLDPVPRPRRDGGALQEDAEGDAAVDAGELVMGAEPERVDPEDLAEEYGSLPDPLVGTDVGDDGAAAEVSVGDGGEVPLPDPEGE